MEKQLDVSIPKSRLAYCLSIDLINSTDYSLNLPSAKQAKFNWALSQQLGPHVRELKLPNTLIKFTGDGWLLLTHDESEVVKLSALALIMQSRFKSEVQMFMSIPDPVPDLRMALCAGEDTLTLLATGEGDYIGNSARRAVRVPKLQANGTIVIDEIVRQKVVSDLELVELPAPDPNDPGSSQLPRKLYKITGIKETAIEQGFWEWVHNYRGQQPESSPTTICTLSLPPDGVWQKLAPLEFAFVWGDLGETCFSPKLVRLKQHDRVWSPPTLVAALTWKLAYQQWKEARRRRSDFHFRPLARVASVCLSDGGIELALESTMYIQVAATNLAIDTSKELKKMLDDWSPAPTAQAWQTFLASALNVIGCVISNDDYLFTPKRGKTFEKPERYQASTGGYYEPTIDVDIEAAFKREITEELGIQCGDIEEVTLFGFGYNELTGEPDFLAMAQCSLSKDEILSAFEELQQKRLQAGKDRGELKAIFKTVEEAEAVGSNWKSVWHLDAGELSELFEFLLAKEEWSQPSDRAAVLGAFCRKLEMNVVAEALTCWRSWL